MYNERRSTALECDKAKNGYSQTGRVTPLIMHYRKITESNYN